MKFTILQCIKASAIIQSGPQSTHLGVCGNTGIAGSECFDEYYDWLRQFPWFSDHPAWPIEGTKLEYDKLGKWEGERGNKRLEICAAVQRSTPFLWEPAYEVCVGLQSIMWHGPRHLSDGLCDNLPVCFSSFLIDYTTFPGYTGEFAFPVEDCAQYNTPGKWDGERGARRRELAAFIQKELINEFLS